jgi:hypothetical protein
MTLAAGRQRLSKVSSSPPARNGYQLWWSASNADASAWPGRPDATTTASSASVGEISFKVHTASKLDSELEDLRLQSRCLRRHGSPHGAESQSDEGDDRGPGPGAGPRAGAGGPGKNPNLNCQCRSATEVPLAARC